MSGKGDMSHRSVPIAIIAYGERIVSDGAICCVHMAEARKLQVEATLSVLPACAVSDCILALSRRSNRSFLGRQ
jgi:hypothetical protein